MGRCIACVTLSLLAAWGILVGFSPAMVPSAAAQETLPGDPFTAPGKATAPGNSPAPGAEETAEPALGLHGYLESRYQAYLRDGSEASARQRLWLEVQGRALGGGDGADDPDASSLRLFSSAGLDGDPVAGRLSDDQKTFRAHLEESYLTLDTRQVDLMVGRKMLRWGTGDGVNPMDLINPVDHREPVSSGRADARVPVELGQLIINLPTGGAVQEATLETVYIPLARIYRLSASGSPWEPYGLRALRRAENEGYLALADQQEPDHAVDDAEAGLRLGVTTNGWDLAAIGFHGVSDNPIFDYRTTEADGATLPLVTPVHPHFTAWGVNVAKGLERSTLRGELALKPDLPVMLEDVSTGHDWVRRPVLEGVAGFDRTFGLNCYVNVQYFWNAVLEQSDNLARDAFTHGATAEIYDLFLQDDLKAGVRGTVSFSKQGSVSELFAEYSIGDDWLLAASLMLFEGPRDGNYGQYSNNDCLTLRLRYSF